MGTLFTLLKEARAEFMFNGRARDNVTSLSVIFTKTPGGLRLPARLALVSWREITITLNLAYVSI